MIKVVDLKIVDAETKTTIGLIQWFHLEASVNSFEWKARWEQKRKTKEGNVMLLRSTDLTEAWFVLDTYEGEVEKTDCDANEIHVKNYKIVSTRAEDTEGYSGKEGDNAKRRSGNGKLAWL